MNPFSGAPLAHDARHQILQRLQGLPPMADQQTSLPAADLQEDLFWAPPRLSLNRALHPHEPKYFPQHFPSLLPHHRTLPFSSHRHFHYRLPEGCPNAGLLPAKTQDPRPPLPHPPPPPLSPL